MRYEVDRLKKEKVEAVQELQKKYEQTIRQKDDQLRSTLSEVSLLKATIQKLNSEMLERRADEEAKLSDKEKELLQLQRQFHD